MLDKNFDRPLRNDRKGVFLSCFFDDKIHQMICSCSLLKWISIHALGFSYGDQIRKISTYQKRRKMSFCILKTKEKWLSDHAHIKVYARTKDDARMAWHVIDDDVE